MIAKKADISDLNALSIKVNNLQANMITADQIRDVNFFSGASIYCSSLQTYRLTVINDSSGNFKKRSIRYVSDIDSDGNPEFKTNPFWCYA